MATLRTCNNRKKGKAFAARPHETMVADYVEDGVPTMHVFWDHGRDRVRGRELRWLRSKRWKACRVIRAEWKRPTSEEARA